MLYGTSRGLASQLAGPRPSCDFYVVEQLVESDDAHSPETIVNFRGLVHASWLVPSVAVVLLAAYSAQYSWPKFLATYSTSLLVALAALVAGALLGFLFGIPRALQQSPGADERNSNSINYTVNTNLEQISDWLTKILVGVGLIQPGSISRGFTRLTVAIGASIGPKPVGPLIAGADILFFSVWGFLLGYLLTRTYLTAAFRAFDVGEIATRAAQEAAAEVSQNSEERQREQDLTDAMALSLASQILTPGIASDNLPEPERIAELEEAIAKASPPIVEQIYQLARTLRTANWNWRASTTGSDNAKKRHERTVPVFEILSKVTLNDYRYQGDLGFSLKDKEQPDYPRSIQQLGIAMRLADSAGAQQAVAWFAVNRAMAQILLGKKEGLSHDWPNRDQILDDIRLAETHGGGPARVTREGVIATWLSENSEH